ncbi:MAG TPA: TonB family protein, partial [Acidobacteriota bacterium]|nr:TonB family protein [Acidobacteriota bacterium]
RNLQTLDGDVYIRFTLKRDGSVEDLEVLRPSVLPALDDASSAAIRRAVLPALPSDFPRNQERVTYRFRIIGFESARQLELQLEQSRWAGEF